jgi:hypothetical protein
MAVSARVVLNRANLNELGLAVATGLEAVVEDVVREADPPDATPYGAGLVTSGGWLVYSRRRKVAGGSLTNRQPKKPRGLRLEDGIVAVAGFSFPGRFQEIGTVHHRAQPFLWPSWTRVAGSVPQRMAPAVRAYLARRR